MDSYARSGEETLGSYLTLWNDYVMEENAMLHRRSSLVGEVETATRNLAKATVSGKAAKTAVALQVKEQKDSELKNATAMGEAEIRRFHQQRLAELKESLVSYAQGQMQVAKDTHEKLSSCLSGLKAFKLPPKSSMVQQSVHNSNSAAAAAAKNMHFPE